MLFEGREVNSDQTVPECRLQLLNSLEKSKAHEVVVNRTEELKNIG